jgi:Family of unknown function (DUF6629)
MCFSAPASFTAAAVIGSIGALTVGTAAARLDRRVLPFAFFPVLFAAQQFVEGLIWLDLAGPAAGDWRPFLINIFQGYAEVLWPIFAPLAVLLIEPDRRRWWLIFGCLVVGVGLSIYLLIAMIGNPYAATVWQGHVVYWNEHRYPVGIEVPYVLATTISLLLSSHPAVRLLGAVILIAFAVAYLAFRLAYISVWCFFAAIASVLVYLHIRQASKAAALASAS